MRLFFTLIFSLSCSNVHAQSIDLSIKNTKSDTPTNTPLSTSGADYNNVGSSNSISEYNNKKTDLDNKISTAKYNNKIRAQQNQTNQVNQQGSNVSPSSTQSYYDRINYLIGR